MDLRQLNTFVQVAELGSLSKAAERLHIAQPALSRQIRLLEQELRTSLFTRHGRGMVPTEAGDALLARAISILRQVEEARADLGARSDVVRGKVVLGLPPTVGDVLAARIITRFTRLYPEVSLRIVPAFTGYLREWLQRGELDLAIMYEQHPADRIHTRPLLTERLFLVADRQAGLRLDRPVGLSAIASHRLILPGPTHSLRQLIEREAAAKRLTLDVPIEADALQTLKDLARRGLGATVLPFASVHEEVAEEKLTAAPVVRPALNRKLVLGLPSGRRASNALSRFTEELLNEIEAMIDGGIWAGKLDAKHRNSRRQP